MVISRARKAENIELMLKIAKKSKMAAESELTHEMFRYWQVCILCMSVAVFILHIVVNIMCFLFPKPSTHHAK